MMNSLRDKEGWRVETQRKDVKSAVQQKTADEISTE